MASEIKETPALRGKNADRFASAIQKNEERRAPRPEYEKVMKNYTTIKALHSK
jgi:hypothetical protein